MLISGCSYTFQLSVQDSDGHRATKSVNVTAGRPPRNGYITISPTAGTTISTEFVLQTANWTGDVSSLPLRFSFEAGLEDGSYYSLNTASASATTGSNLTTPLPLGYGILYALPLAGVAEDSLGAQAKVDATALVTPPSDDKVISLVENQSSIILDTISSGALDDALTRIQACGAVLNYMLDENEAASEYVNDDTIAAAAVAAIAQASAVRSYYINLTRSASQTAAATTTMVEATAVCVEFLSSSAQESLSSSDQLGILNIVSDLANSSAKLSSISSTASSSSINTLSNLLTAGILEDGL